MNKFLTAVIASLAITTVVALPTIVVEELHHRSVKAAPVIEMSEKAGPCPQGRTCHDPATGKDFYDDYYTYDSSYCYSDYDYIQVDRSPPGPWLLFQMSQLGYDPRNPPDFSKIRLSKSGC